MTSAVVGAGVVALSAGAALPKYIDQGTPSAQASAQFIAGADRLDQAGVRRASRAEARSATASTLDQPAPDVWLLPIRKYHVTSPFGKRFGGTENHPGVDLGAAEGTPYYAAAAGTVVLARWNGGYGYNIMIDHGNGITSVYGHSSKLIAREGQKVKAGDLIGLVGNTGHSFGSHLHYELRQNNVAIEPTAFMKKRGVDILQHADAIEDGPSSD
jgi:murein DD-endopeptidase MepM/ murein hydrolase activator NlpD